MPAPTSSGFPEKVAAIAALQAARNSGEEAEIFLRISGKKNEADQIWEKNSRLRIEIDILIGRLMDAWIADATTQTATLAAIRGQIDASVAKIKSQLETAAQVVKILGLLDDTLKIAIKFLA